MGMGGRVLTAAEQAEFDAFAVRARALGLEENPNIRADLKANSSQVVAGQPFNQTIQVQGQAIRYTAYRLEGGIINVGRITLPCGSYMPLFGDTTLMPRKIKSFNTVMSYCLLGSVAAG